MEKGYLKDLYNQKRYSEVIVSLKYLFIGLFCDMLDYKKIDTSVINYNKMNYNELSVLIRKYYPEFSDNLTILSVAGTMPDMTYLDTINSYLTTYSYMKNTYKG